MWEFEGEHISGNPAKLVTFQSSEYVTAFLMFKSGFLPNAGGWMDQPAKFVDAVNLIDSQIAKIKEEKRKNEQ